MIKVCEYCKKEFETIDKRQKYCGSECYYKFMRSKKKVSATKTVRECIYCDKEITTEDRELFCTSECQISFYSNRIQVEEEIINKAKIKNLYDKICLWCGKEFMTRYKDKLLCCKECRWRYADSLRKAKRAANIQQKECLWCGKGFTTYKKTQMFCSRSCKIKHRCIVLSKKRREEEREVIRKFCPICGKEFISYHKTHHIHCSMKCYNKYRVIKAKIETSQVCQNCGKEFIVHHKHQQYCSAECISIVKKLRRGTSYGDDIIKMCKCGERFVTKYKQQIYCTKKCQKRHMARKLRAKKIKPAPSIKPKENIIKFCEGCGERFVTKIKKQIFCTISCGNRHRKMLSRAKKSKGSI